MSFFCVASLKERASKYPGHSYLCIFFLLPLTLIISRFFESPESRLTYVQLFAPTQVPSHQQSHLLSSGYLLTQMLLYWLKSSCRLIQGVVCTHVCLPDVSFLLRHKAMSSHFGRKVHKGVFLSTLSILLEQIYFMLPMSRQRMDRNFNVTILCHMTEIPIIKNISHLTPSRTPCTTLPTEMWTLE